MPLQLAQVGVFLAPIAGVARPGVKVDDTVPSIEEGRKAGMWTEGLRLSGNEVGYSLEEYASAPAEEVSMRIAAAEQKLLAAGAHYVVQSVRDLSVVLLEIGAPTRAGERA